jgi:hypothetical protein
VNVASEEIAEAQELSDLVYIGRRWSVFDRLEFVGAGQDTLFCQPEAKVRNFFAAKETLLQVYLDAMLDQLLQNIAESNDVFWVSGRMDEKVINEHNYIGEPVDDSFHQALEAGGAAQQAHGTGDPLELAHARHSEGCLRACPGVQNHLPETSSEVNCTEDGTARATDFANALTDVLH